MALATISGGGSFTNRNISDINGNFTSLANQLAGTTGNMTPTSQPNQAGCCDYWKPRTTTTPTCCRRSLL